MNNNKILIWIIIAIIVILNILVMTDILEVESLNYKTDKALVRKQELQEDVLYMLDRIDDYHNIDTE